MSIVTRHRVKGEIFKVDNATNTQTTKSNNEDTVFINDELSAHNRKLLWLAKAKAKEQGWKFAWYKNGQVLAKKKNETSNTIFILNTWCCTFNLNNCSC